MNRFVLTGALLTLAASLANGPAIAGSIAGRITDSETQAGLAAQITIYDANGGFVGFTFTDPGTGDFDTEGDTNVPDLASGTYFAKTFNFIGYFNTLYENLDCLSNFQCDVTQGTPIEVTQGVKTTGINWSMNPGGGIVFGTVTDEKGDPLATLQEVFLFTEDGLLFSAGYDPGSGFTVGDGLPTGIYYAQTNTNSGLANQLSGGRPCLNAFCAATLGEPIFVNEGQSSGPINFSLSPGGSISGTIIDIGPKGDNAPAGGVAISAYDSSLGDGDAGYIGTAFSDSEGNYTLSGFPDGNYTVATSSFRAYDREVYDDLPCNGRCNPEDGDTLALTTKSALTGVDFGLTSGKHRVRGQVTDEMGMPIAGVEVSLYRADGSLFDIGTSAGSNGFYTILSGVPEGTYYLLARDPLSRYVSELNGDIPCPAECDPTTGQAIELVGPGGETTQITFELAVDRVFRDAFGW